MIHALVVVEKNIRNVVDKCHKITVAACLQSISTNLDLIVQKGIATKKLMVYKELAELADKEEAELKGGK
ncbi:hypothetical protein LCGC14_2424400 [marine sediment metagenome]|uniref:Uncharacterized protein n=1 Tax=marine sediment metagenome TaxID=412755 RepID=A0A0F9CAX1_9ZZZZ